jgi:hypothetical protein
MSSYDSNGYQYKGCWIDSSRDRALKDNIGNGNIGDCIKLAKEKGYNTVGIQAGNQCWAGNNGKNGNNYKMHGERFVKRMCSPTDPGEYTNVVYQYDGQPSNSKETFAAAPTPPSSISGYNYKGCYKDSTTRALKNQIGSGNITDCVNLASSKGYDTVGIQYTNQCWAGNNGTDGNNYSEYGVQTNTADCNINAAGAYTNMVYQKPTIPTPPSNISGYNYLGCYKDSTTRAIKNQIGSGNITDCVNLAKSKGYNTAAIQYTNQCFAGNNGVDGNNYDAYGVQTDTSYCNIDAAGPYTNMVYQINMQSQKPAAKLLVNQKLNVGQVLASDNGLYYLILQQDGNLVVYNNQDKALWAAGTSGKKSAYLIMQTDNNFCVYPSSGSGAFWCAMSEGSGAVQASMDNDGVLRLYNSANKAVWTFGTPVGPFNNTPSAIKPVTNTYSPYAVPVFIAGTYGCGPWGTTSFPDKTANWIWYSQMSNTNANTNATAVTIQYIWNNNFNIPLEGKLNIIIDNYADVLLNGTQIATNIAGGWGGGFPVIAFTAPPGSNLFEFQVKNAGGPAGLIVSAITVSGGGPNSSDVLFHSDSTWKFISTMPTHITTCTVTQTGLVTSSDKYFPWGCLSFNGSSSQYINTGPIITGMNGLTFGCWFKSNNNSTYARIFDFGNGAPSDNIILYLINNTLIAELFVTTSDAGGYTLSTTNVNNNVWNHIVWTLSAPNSSGVSLWLAYLNGKQIYTNTTGQYPVNIARTSSFIGKSNWAGNPFWNGSFANFVMYQKAISGVEANALYNNLINTSDPTLYLYMPLSINSVLDTTINNYAGKTYNLPIQLSKVENENWNCMKEGNDYINVKMVSDNPSCMSLDGKTCVIENESECKILSINPVTPEMPIVCSPNQTGWCSEAKKFLTTLTDLKIPATEKTAVSLNQAKPASESLSALNFSSEGESLNLKPLLGGGKVLAIKNMIDVNNLMIGGIFKLRVNLPMMPPYIKGQSFNTETGINPNYFYLCIEKLDPNCSIKNPNGTCQNVYADQRKCNIKSLTSYVQTNTFRLVLVSSQYVLDSSIPFGKNSDFTIVTVGGNLYLKNVQTGYLPSLYINLNNILIYGDMQINDKTNINTVEPMINNVICGQEAPVLPDSGTQNVRCNMQQDPGQYLMTSNNIGESSPIRVNINNNNTISLNLLSFNNYGFPTSVYSLTYCNFNVQTYAFIEKITNTLGTFLVNMVCFTNVRDPNASVQNQLQFVVELISFPKNFVKNNSIFSVS